MKASIANWGLYPAQECTILEPASYEDLAKAIAGGTEYIARGNGRCYGDASLSKNIISTTRLNRILHFDKSGAIIHCQSGVLLSAVLEYIVPQGFFLPITPGTKFITVGGAFASDIHGKNHHVDGVFSDHVVSITLMEGSGKILELFPADDLFYQTAGGMGLTGVILELKIRLKHIETAYIRQTALRASNLEEIFHLFEENKRFTYSVAWIDCLAKGKHIGRSVLLLGEHALPGEVRQADKLKVHQRPFLTIPFFFPTWLLNAWFVKLFNFLYYHKPSSGQQRAIVHYDAYFYPLDRINHWNKIYGHKGFIQYQFVIPKENSYEGVRRILEILSKNRLGSFLAVLKLFGKSHDNRYLHFPIEGYTLALDIKIEDRIWPILDHLDEIVTRLGGKVYLTKDARLSHRNFQIQYPQPVAPHAKFNSHQLIRLRQGQQNVLLVLGANSDIAREAALAFMQKNPNGFLLLASRDTQSLNKFVVDHQLQKHAHVMPFNAEDVSTVKPFVSSLPYKPTFVLYAAGVLAENHACFDDSALWVRNVTVNFTGAVAVLNALVEDNNPFLRRIVGISSIAGLRGRKSNFMYGAAKAGFHQYLFGLRQQLRSRKVLVQALTPGFVKTKMTAHLLLNHRANTAEAVAAALFSGNTSFELYPNFFWKMIAKVIRLLPEKMIARI